VHELLDRRDVHRRREGVVGGLRHVDVVVRVERLLRAEHAALELDGPVGDDLVGVHVGLGPAAGLEDAERELLVEGPVGYLGRGLGDPFGRARIELAEIRVDEGRGPLQDAEGPDDRAGHRLVADVEVVQRTGCLGAPVHLGRDLDLTHAVGLDAGAAQRVLLTPWLAPVLSFGEPGPGRKAIGTTGPQLRSPTPNA
jgi:hypothetical protein